MKKVLYLLSTFALVAMFAACSNPESDAQKAAKKGCDCLKVMNDTEKFEACSQEMEKLGDEMEKKYTSEEDQKAFQDAYMDALKDCDVDLGLGL
jgi:hypothetical protein